MTSQIGSDIRALRKTRRSTLQEVGAAIGRSVGWLSQVERGQTTPSVRDLGLIADHFGMNISFFFRSAGRRTEEQGVVLRKADRPTIGSTETGLTEELLSPSLSGSFEMIRSVFAPRSTSGGPVAVHEREDGGVLLSGRLSLTIGDLEVDLEAGDSFQFAGKAYAWRNNGDEPAMVLWIVSPPVY